MYYSSLQKSFRKCILCDIKHSASKYLIDNSVSAIYSIRKKDEWINVTMNKNQ